MADRYLLSNRSPEIPIRGNTFFFDTNIWLFLYGPFPDPSNRKVQLYSKFYKTVLTYQGIVAIDELVVAEFINRYIHDQHRFLIKEGEADPRFKAFRGTETYQNMVTGISDELASIFETANKVGLDCNMDDLKAWVDEFATLPIDFNDLLFAKSCKKHGMFLVTDDGDLSFPDIAIVTANYRLAKGQ